MTDGPLTGTRQPRAPRLVGGPPRLLGTIDLGENMGWSIGPMDASAPASSVRFKTFSLRATTKLGLFLRSSEDAFREMFSTPGLVGIGVEKPDTMGNGYFGIRKNMALLGQMYVWLEHHGLSQDNVQEISVTSGKLRLSGSGRAKKPEMIAAALAKGYAVETEHEADAAGIREVFLFGKAETKAQREKRKAQERRDARDALKKAQTPGDLF